MKSIILENLDYTTQISNLNKSPIGHYFTTNYILKHDIF